MRCSCGNTFTTRSTKGGELHVELCNECHPFFTGKQKLVDTGGRVERFERRYGKRKTDRQEPTAPRRDARSAAPPALLLALKLASPRPRPLRARLRRRPRPFRRRRRARARRRRRGSWSRTSPAAALGRALAWARQQGVDRLHVAGRGRRRAPGPPGRGLRRRRPTSGRSTGRTLVPAVAEPAARAARRPRPAARRSVDLIEAAGAEPVGRARRARRRGGGARGVPRRCVDPHVGRAPGSRSVSASTTARPSSWCTATCRPVEALAEVVAEVGGPPPARRAAPPAQPPRPRAAAAPSRWCTIPRSSG